MDLGKEELLAFNPRDPAYRGYLWARVVSDQGAFYHIFWRRIGIFLVVGTLVGWLALAGAAWMFVKHRRGFKEVSYLDLALYPLRQEQYHARLGRHYVAEGRAAIARQEYQSGYTLLSAGVARVPEDLEARKELAATELAFGRIDRATQTMVGGLRYARDNQAYLKQLFAMLAELQDDERILTLSAELLPVAPDQNRTNQFIALQAATAHYQRGRPDQVERLVAEWNLDRSLEGQILLARCDWDLGLRELALVRLEQQLALFPRRDEAYFELVRMHREAGHAAEAHRFALLRQFNDPQSPGPRVDLLYGYRSSGDTAAEKRELESYLQAFGTDAKALQLLASFAVETGQPALAERLAGLAAAGNLAPLPFLLARIQACVAVRDYQGANDLAESIPAEATTGRDYSLALLNAQRAVALCGLGEVARAQSMLSSFLERSRVRTPDALIVARQLQTVEQPALAHRVLERAVQTDSFNQPALAELVRLAASSGNREAILQHVPALLAARKPARTALEAALKALGEPSDEPLRAQIRAVLNRPSATAGR